MAGLPFRSGATVIFGSKGEVRYIASKPSNSAQLPAELQRDVAARRKATLGFIEELDDRDPRMAYAGPKYLKDRMTLRARFRALHDEA